MKKHLIKIVLDEIPRIFNFVDTNKNSKTYGCCYYPYWRGEEDPLIPEPNFVNARWQEVALTLSLLYSKNYPNNIYFKNKKILELTKIIILYWVKIQNRDGSFSEWSIYEHGQPPTSFGLFAMIEAYKIMKGYFDRNECKKIENSFRKAANWLCKNNDTLALNHETVAIAALYSAYKLFKTEKYLKKITEKINLVHSFQSKEGWIKEIDGPDSGYNSVSLMYLSLYWKNSRDTRVLPLIKKILNFNKFFVYPDGVFGGGINSRFASASWLLGYAILSNNYEMAKSLFYITLKSMIDGKIKGQYNYTDYQRCVALYYSLMSYEELKNVDSNGINLKIIPSFSSKIFVENLKESKISIIKNKDYYLVLGPGCCIGELYSYKNVKTVIYTSPMNLVDISGIIIERKDGVIFSSMTRNNFFRVIFSKNKIQYVGRMYPVNFGRWKSVKNKKRMLYFKRILHFFYNYAPFINKIIFFIFRSLFKKKSQDFAAFERSLSFEKNLHVKNRIFLKKLAEGIKNLEIRETIFIPMGSKDSDFTFSISKKKYFLKQILSKDFSIKNLEIYLKNKKILEISFDEIVKVSFVMKDENEMSKNNMKFTCGKGLVIRMLPQQNTRKDVYLNYKISL